MPWSNEQPRTIAWAREVKARAGGKCQIAGPSCTGHADIADHIVPIAEGGSLYDVRNGQGACKPCHDAKTRDESARGRRRLYAKAKHPAETHPGRRG